MKIDIRALSMKKRYEASPVPATASVPILEATTIPIKLITESGIEPTSIGRAILPTSPLNPNLPHQTLLQLSIKYLSELGLVMEAKFKPRLDAIYKLVGFN
ncbi:MAG: hypothetical protein QXQ31_07345 [Zestosphaera sp.]